MRGAPKQPESNGGTHRKWRSSCGSRSACDCAARSASSTHTSAGDCAAHTDVHDCAPDQPTARLFALIHSMLLGAGAPPSSSTKSPPALPCDGTCRGLFGSFSVVLTLVAQ